MTLVGALARQAMGVERESEVSVYVTTSGHPASRRWPSVSWLLLASAVGCDEATGPAPVPPEQEYRLTTAVSPGAALDVSPSQGSYAPGTVVSYEANLDAGHQNLLVHIDGEEAVAAGSITMDDDRVLSATADRVITPSPAEEELVGLLRASIEDSGPDDNHRQLTEALDDLVDSEGPSQAVMSLRRARVLAFHPLEDAAAISQAVAAFLEARQPDREAAVQLPSHVWGGAESLGSARGDTDAVAFIYVNGIWTTLDEAIVTRRVLEKSILEPAGFRDRTLYPVTEFYNPSALDADQQVSSAHVCLFLIAAGLVSGNWSVSELVDDCVRTAIAGAVDLDEAVTQLIVGLVGDIPPLARPASRELADTIDVRLRRGESVVTVGHSQGNLMIREALSILEQRAAPIECVGVVSIAPPSRIRRDPQLPQVADMIIEGEDVQDVLLRLPGLSAVPRVRNSITEEYDNTDIGWLKLAVDFYLHSINESYLTSPRDPAASVADGIAGARETIIEGLKSNVAAVQGCLESTPDLVSIEIAPAQIFLGAGEEIQVHATALDESGEPIPGVPFVWSSTDPDVASVSQAGVVAGVAQGAATVNVQSQEVYGSAAVTVAEDGDGHTLLFGETRIGSISPARDVDTWRLVAEEGDFIAAGMGKGSEDATLYPHLALVSPRGDVLDISHDRGGALVGARAPEGGTYVLRASSDDGGLWLDGTGSYKITAVVSGEEHTVSLGDHGGMLANGATELGALYGGDLDAWTFIARQGSFIAAGLGEAEGTELLPYLRLVSPSGEVLHAFQADGGALVGRRAPESGTYLLIAASHDGGLNSSGSYRITLLVSGDSLSVSPGDEGGRLLNGASKSGYLYAGELDGWTFAANEGDYIAAGLGEAGGTDLLPYLRLVSPSGAVLDFGQGSDGALVGATAPETGTYLLILASNDGGHRRAGTYGLSLVTSGGDLTVSEGDEGGEMANGTEFGHLDKGELDGWTFRAAPGDHIAAVFEEAEGDDLLPYLRLVAPSGTVLAFDQGSVAASVDAYATEDGQYLLILASNDGGHTRAGRYRLSLVVSR